MNTANSGEQPPVPAENLPWYCRGPVLTLEGLAAAVSLEIATRGEIVGHDNAVGRIGALVVSFASLGSFVSSGVSRIRRTSEAPTQSSEL